MNIGENPASELLNVAVTDVADVMVTTQVPVPEHAPDHPAKPKPPSGVAVSVTIVPWAKGAVHVAPQFMPAGLLVTVPVPPPDLVTDRLNCCRVNVAVTVAAAVIVIVQFPVPEHPPPDQPENVVPAKVVAVSVTVVPPL